VLLFLLPEFKYIRFIFDWKLWRQMMWYTMPLTLVGLAAVINQLISIPLMKSLLPYSIEVNMEQIGIYGACYKIAILMSLFTQAFNFAAEPFFFRNSNRTDAKQTYIKVAQAFTLVGSLIFLGIMLYLDIIQYFIGKDFREGLAVVPILLLAYLFLGIYYCFSMWYKLTDQTHFGATISIIGVAITLALNLVLIPRIGYLGGAWAALGCYASMTILSYGLGQKYYPVDYPIGRMMLYIGSAVLIYLAGNQLAGFTEGSWIGKMIVSTLLLMVWVGGIYFGDRESLRGMVRS
jgi:O-antigen/teichoic acid export membrane protein